MRNASGYQCKVKMSGSEKKSEQERVRHFLQRSFWKFHVVKSHAKQRQRNVKKKVCLCKVAFLLIRPIIVFHRCSALPSQLSITRFYILFEQTLNII